MNIDNEPRTEDRSPEGLIFSIESDIKNMMKDYEVAVRNGENQRAQMIADAIDRMQKKKIELQGGIADMAMRKQMAKGDEAKKENGFPDLSGDGKITRKDILMGQGVEFAEGGEAIGDDLAGMAMSEEEAMAEVGNAEKEMAMIQQLVTVVQQLLAEGISEDDLVAFLKEQGLDDEDIDSLMQMVLQSQSEQRPDQIGQELQGMM